MKMKKGLTSLLSVAVLSLSASAVISASSADVRTLNGENIIPISANVDQKEQANFQSITGVVKEINDFGKDGDKIVSVEGLDKKEIIANIIIDSNTYLVDEAKLAVGTQIIAFFDATKPVIMIYPPQLVAEAVAIVNEKQNVKLDRFDKNMISSDNQLELKIDKDTKITLQDGTAFDGELEGRKLVVTYGISTKSLPAQTAPDQIVVLFEEAVPVDEPTVEPGEEVEEPSTIIGDVGEKKFVVNDKIIEAPAAFLDEDGTVMVPLRAIAEALDFELTWEAPTKSVRLNNIISLQVGKDYYVYSRTAPIELGTAPVIVEGNAYVPLAFFKKVAQLNNAYVFEDTIVIDDNEEMK
ncbi:copper amine oxidase N-terminal domain-containing protein [Paenibacillaceae bacterium]|nr:copper amine oxidase N-terminal domain-containing protein [Paenibacillaceae bacterium]